MSIQTIGRIILVYAAGILLVSLGVFRINLAARKPEEAGIRPIHEKILFGGDASKIQKQIYLTTGGIAALILGTGFITLTTWLLIS